VLHNFNLDGFDALYPRYAGGRSPSFTLAQRRQIPTTDVSRNASNPIGVMIERRTPRSRLDRGVRA
jgi:hypothetical protein